MNCHKIKNDIINSFINMQMGGDEWWKTTAQITINLYLNTCNSRNVPCQAHSDQRRIGCYWHIPLSSWRKKKKKEKENLISLQSRPFIRNDSFTNALYPCILTLNSYKWNHGIPSLTLITPLASFTTFILPFHLI